MPWVCDVMEDSGLGTVERSRDETRSDDRETRQRERERDGERERRELVYSE